MAKTMTYQNASEALRGYLQTRRAVLDGFVERHYGLRECFSIQRRFWLADLVRNPINVFWAIPSLSLRKGLEVAEKLGLELARSLAAKVPTAFKTDFQREVEATIAVELFGLSREPRGPWVLAENLAANGDERVRDFIAEAEKEVRAEIAEFCGRQNGASDLASSGVTILLADFFFHDRSLDVFGIGRRFAALWARDQAESEFFLGKSIGKAFYSLAPPEPTRWQVVVSTALLLAGLALFTTFAGIAGLAAQKRIGLKRAQLAKLITQVEDKLLLRLAKRLG